MKKVAKILGALVCAVLVIAVCGLIYFVSQLPEPGTFNEALNPKEKKEIAVAGAPTLAKPKTTPTALAPTDSLEKESPESLVSKKAESEFILKTLRKEDISDIRVCQNLGNPTLPISQDVLTNGLMNTDRSDPGVEAWRSYIKAIFHSKPINELFTEVEKLDSVPKEEREQLMQKLGFYSFATKKAYEIYAMKSDFEKLGDHIFHLHLIAEVVQRRPELRNDSAILGFCNELQNSIANQETTDIDEERKEILKLIEYAKLTPKELHFDPTKKSEFKMDLGKKSISFGLSHPGMTL